jgi:hypothetical protein
MAWKGTFEVIQSMLALAEEVLGMYVRAVGASARTTYLANEKATPRLSRTRWRTLGRIPGVRCRTSAGIGSCELSTITVQPETLLMAA